MSKVQNQRVHEPQRPANAYQNIVKWYNNWKRKDNKQEGKEKKTI